MNFLVKVEPTGSADAVRIVSVEMHQDTVTGDAAQKIYVFNTTVETEINKLLNNYDKVGASIVSGTLQLVFNDASEEPQSRGKLADWKMRVRPALLRAATATNMFNL